MSESVPHRAWANSSLAAALLWIVLAALPVPGTTLLGVPFGLYAIGAGLYSLFERRAARDRVGTRRARWGVGLGCVGFIIGFALDLVVAGTLVAALVAGVHALWGVHLP